jgi:predicted nucleic acid-binding protein
MKHAFVDANVILRFLTGDPPDLAAQARTLFEAVDGGQLALILDEIVVAETVWVLQSFYAYPSDRISQVLQRLLSHDGLKADRKAGLLLALNLFAERDVDFADALLAVHMAQQGTKDIYSFDHHFDRLPDVRRHVPGK